MECNPSILKKNILFMPYPAENTAIAQYIRLCLKVAPYAIPLTAPLKPGLTISGITSPSLNGDFQLQDTEINGKPWLKVGVAELKADVDGYYHLNFETPGANYFTSDRPYADPYSIESWVAHGTATGTIETSKVFGLDVDAVDSQQAYYLNRRYFKRSTAGWDEFVTSDSTIGNVIVVSKSDYATDDRAGLPVYGTQYPFATIQKAIYSAIPGDNVVVYPGVYNEKIVIRDQVDLEFLFGAEINYTGTENGALISDSVDGGTVNIKGGSFLNNSNTTDDDNYLIKLISGGLTILIMTAVDRLYMDIDLAEGETHLINIGDNIVNIDAKRMECSGAGADNYLLYAADASFGSARIKSDYMDSKKGIYYGSAGGPLNLTFGIFDADEGGLELKGSSHNIKGDIMGCLTSNIFYGITNIEVGLASASQVVFNLTTEAANYISIKNSRVESNLSYPLGLESGTECTIQNCVLRAQNAITYSVVGEGILRCYGAVVANKPIDGDIIQQVDTVLVSADVN